MDNLSFVVLILTLCQIFANKDQLKISRSTSTIDDRFSSNVDEHVDPSKWKMVSPLISFDHRRRRRGQIHCISRHTEGKLFVKEIFFSFHWSAGKNPLTGKRHTHTFICSILPSICFKEIVSDGSDSQSRRRNKQQIFPRSFPRGKKKWSTEKIPHRWRGNSLFLFFSEKIEKWNRWKISSDILRIADENVLLQVNQLMIIRQEESAGQRE